MRQRVTEEQIRLAKSVDLISYMKQYEPQELIRTGPHDYKTTTHSSLCISDNGLWHWFSHGVGGRGALNYLIQVKGMDFVSAVRHLCELEHLTPVPFQQSQSGPPPQHERRPFTLPVPDKNAETALQYLKRRGIDSKILKYCIDQGILYQTTRGGYKNCVFVGRDTEGQPRSACVRGCQGTFRGECAGSEKQYGFCIPAGNETADIVEVYEAPIDALSGATLQLLYGHDWRSVHHISLGGLNYVALDQYLKDHPKIKKLRLRLDNDERGRDFALRLQERYKNLFTTKPFFTSWGSAAKPVATSRKSLTSRRTASAPTAFTTAGRPAAASALPVWPLTCGTVGTATGARRLTTCSIANMRRT